MKASLQGLEEAEARRFWKARQDKINAQLHNLFLKQEQEEAVLDEKLNLLIREQDKIRKKEQEDMLKKFTNL